jgi:hypothetical protein
VDCHQTDAAQQTTRRTAGERPWCSQWYLLDLAVALGGDTRALVPQQQTLQHFRGLAWI